MWVHISARHLCGGNEIMFWMDGLDSFDGSSGMDYEKELSTTMMWEAWKRGRVNEVGAHTNLE